MAKYDDLYWKYKGCVVLMLKKYMYVAYDESARVLNYLLEYKLFESFNGLTACGPDKDKIKRILSAHHVNFVISELGKISESNSFEDNCFYKYLALANKKTDAKDVNPIVIQPHEATLSTQIAPTNQSITLNIPDWLTEGVFVSHKEYGSGIVKQIKINSTNIVIIVVFGNLPQKCFLYPDAFAKGILEKM